MDDGQIAERLDRLDARLEAVAEDAAGAHEQAKRTNGRVDRLEKYMLTVRRTLFGSERDAMSNDGGLVGWVRTTRRDIRILGVLIVTVMPIVTVWLTHAFA